MKILIPGRTPLNLEHLVLDYNGTIACDGKIISGVKERLNALSDDLNIHIITADTFGSVKSNTGAINCTIAPLGTDNQDRGKLDFLNTLNAETCVSVGNGFNDHMMTARSAIGIALIQNEGASSKTLLTSDIVCTSIIDALDLLLNPLRLIATLRC